MHDVFLCFPPFQTSRGGLRLLLLHSSCMFPLVLVHGKIPDETVAILANHLNWMFYHIVTPKRWKLLKQNLVLWLARLQYIMTCPEVKFRPRKKNLAFFSHNNTIVLFFDPIRCACKMLYLKSGHAQAKHKKGY